MGILSGKHIVLGISGSIAAYKAAVLTRLLVRKGAEVQIVITPAGKEFITPITLSALSSRPVISEFFSGRDGTWNSHVDIGLWADAMVIAPATAATIGKMAHGVADNMLLTTYLSMKAPVFIAPAMDLDMFAHPSTTDNLDLLSQRGNFIIEPQSGELASHLVGKGRMEEPEGIVAALEDFFSSTLDYEGASRSHHGWADARAYRPRALHRQSLYGPYGHRPGGGVRTPWSGGRSHPRPFVTQALRSCPHHPCDDGRRDAAGYGGGHRGD